MQKTFLSFLRVKLKTCVKLIGIVHFLAATRLDFKWNIPSHDYVLVPQKSKFCCEKPWGKTLDKLQCGPANLRCTVPVPVTDSDSDAA